MQVHDVITNIPVFRDKKMESCAILAIQDIYGPSQTWDKVARMHARKFARTVYDLTPESLSLASLKDALAGIDPKGALNRIAYRFLVRMQKDYRAPDAKAFREIMPVLKKKSRTYRILFSPDVASFEDVTFNAYYNRTDFYVIHAADRELKGLLRRFYMRQGFSTSNKPSQDSIDFLAALLEHGLAGKPIPEGKCIPVSCFFNALDRLAALQKEGRLDEDERKEAVGDLIRFFRYCIETERRIEAAAPFTDLSVFKREAMVRFCLYEYKSRETTFVFRRRGQAKEPFPVTVDIENPVIRAAVGHTLLSGTVSYEEYLACRDTFADSLGDAEGAIRSYADWTEWTLFRQVDYYRKMYRGQKYRTYALSFVKAFYLSVNAQTNGEFFRRAKTLTYGLLVSKRFVNYCELGFEFRPYSDYEPVTEGKRVVFIVRGFNEKMKKYQKDDYIAIDLSSIRDDFYRSLAWRAITSKEGRLYRNQFPYTLRHLLGYLPLLKKKEGWWTPDPQVFSIYDALATAVFFERKAASPVMYNNWMQNVRDFLRWAEDTRRLRVDKTAFDLLNNMKTPTIQSNTPVVPPGELDTILTYFLQRAHEDTDHAQALILLNLTIITPLRIGHSCSLLQEELVRDEATDSIVVNSTGKTTFGEPVRLVLGRIAGQFIKKALAINAQVGLQCTQEELRENVFLYEYNGTYHVWTPKRFGRFLSEACEACGIPHYTSRNLRATYMTRAYIECCKEGFVNEYTLKLFSFHRRVGTTLEHYVNHCEAFMALRDALSRGKQWHETLYPDERQALRATIAEYDALIESEPSESRRAILIRQRDEYKNKLETL